MIKMNLYPYFFSELNNDYKMSLLMTVLELYGAKINEVQLNYFKNNGKDLIIKQIDSAHKLTDIIKLVETKEFAIIHHDRYRMDALAISLEIAKTRQKI